MNSIISGLSSIPLTIIGPWAFAHEGKVHSVQKEKSVVADKSGYEKINDQYISEVRPIFQKKCLDCHGSQVSDAWYRNLPGAKQLIDRDIKESKVHLDMSSDFPFKSHATPLEDLNAIIKSIDSDEMPPLRYRMMHSNSSLSADEKEAVRKWVQFGIETLNSQ